MATRILGMDVVVRNIEIVSDNIDEGVIRFLVRSMRTTIHQLQRVAFADVVGDNRRIMADNL